MRKASLGIFLGLAVLWAAITWLPIKSYDPKLVVSAQKINYLFNEGRIDEALQLSLELADHYPKNSEAWILLGSAYYGKAYGLPRKDTYHVVDPDSAHAAIESFKKGLKIEPSHNLMRLMTAKLLAATGYHDESRPYFKRAFSSDDIRAHPIHRYYITDYANTLAAIGEKEQAIDELQRSLRVNNYDDSLMARYYMFIKVQEGDLAAQIVLAELASQTTQLGDLKNAECYLTRLARQYLQARDCYEQVAKNNQKQDYYRIEAFGTLVNLALRDGEHYQAIAYARQGLSIFSNVPYLYYQLGHAQYNEGLYAEAEQSYLLGLNLIKNQLDTRDYYAKLFLGDTYWQLGKLDAAKNIYSELENASVKIYRDTAHDRQREMYEKTPTGAKPGPRPEAWEHW